MTKTGSQDDTVEQDRTSPVLFSTYPDWAHQQKVAERINSKLGGTFQSPSDMVQYYRYIFTAPSGAWLFKPNSKAGITSTLHFLFHLEFGIPLNVKAQEPNGIMGDHAAHELATARIFPWIIARRDDASDDSETVFDSALRLTVVRHPMKRAISGFNYLCKADAQASDRFVMERLRLSALTGFDWTRHPGTVGGFRRYLDWVEAEMSSGGSRGLDSHFRSQVGNVRPEILQPDLIGRTEDMPFFFSQIAERLERPLPEGAIDAPVRNQTRPLTVIEADIGARTEVARIFAEDFEAFAYDPNEVH